MTLSSWWASPPHPTHKRSLGEQTQAVTIWRPTWVRCPRNANPPPQRANRGKGHSPPLAGVPYQEKHSPEECPLLPGPMSSAHGTLAASLQRPLLRPRPQGPLLSHMNPHTLLTPSSCVTSPGPTEALSPFSDQHSRPHLLPQGHTHTSHMTPRQTAHRALQD